MPAKGDGSATPPREWLLAGSTGWFDGRAAFLRRAAQLGLARDSAEHLSASYGTAAETLLDLIAARPRLGERLIPDLPYIEAEVIHACRSELALTLEDVLARRTHIAIEDRSRGSSVAPRVAALMKGELSWSPPEQRRQLEAYAAFVRQETGPLSSAPVAES